MEMPPPQIADAFQIALENGEIVIEFGHVAGAAPELGETSVTVTDRVRIPLEAARRLTHMLDDSLKPHAAGLRRAEARGLAPADAAAAVRPGQASSRLRPDQSGEQAARLLRLVGEWDVPHQYERSFQMSEGSLRSNRFLLSVNAADIPGDKMESALAVCDRMGMPSAQRETAAAHFAMAKCVHFGFEGDAQSMICKLYLERAVPQEEAVKSHGSCEPALLHLAFKWSLMRAESVTTKYVWRPLIKADEIARRIGEIYRDGPNESRAIATDFLSLAAGAAAAETLQYLEVEEAENARRSFDLNVYNAKLQIRDAQNLLHRMRAHFNIRPGQFQALYDQIKSLSLGHLAGGVHRNGADFFNLYYGVVGLPRFSGRLRQD